MTNQIVPQSANQDISLQDAIKAFSDNSLLLDDTVNRHHRSRIELYVQCAVA